jgi:hypothetical protein
MDLRPPTGSMISVAMEGADTVITVPHGRGSAMRYFVGLFLLFWLVGWFAAFSSTISKIMSGGASTSDFVGLAGWTVAGAFAMVFLYHVVRPSVPETLRLTRGGLNYDSGRPPFRMYFYPAHSTDAWKSMFPKRIQVELDRRRLQTLRLRETPDGNRLTVDADLVRLDIAKSASEIEREWLYQVLAKRYAPAPASEGA